MPFQGVEGDLFLGSGGSPFLMSKVILLLLTCPRGVFYQGLVLNKVETENE